MSALLILAYGVADAALWFRGPMADYITVAVGILVLGALIQVAIIGGFSRLPSAQGGEQEAITVVMAAILFDLQQRVTFEQLLPTSIAAISLGSLVLALTLGLSARYRVGRYVRLLPFPLIAGFLAGSGMLLIVFSFSVLHGEDLGLRQLISSEGMFTWPRIAAGLLMTAVLLAVARLGYDTYGLPCVLLLAVLLFHLAGHYGPVSMQQLIESNWTMTRQVVAVSYPPLPLAEIVNVDWHALLAISPQLVSLAAVGLFANLIKLSVLELSLRQPIDENRELGLAGKANFLCALSATAPGFHSVSQTLLVARVRGDARISGCVAIVVCLAALFFAGDLLSLMPRFVFCALLIWVGIVMVQDGLIATWGKLRFYDSMMILLIALCVLFFGFLAALMLGMCFGLLVFVFEYGQQEGVRNIRDAAQLRSNVDRPEVERTWLDAEGGKIVIVRLHGYLFFGSASRAVEQITRHIRHQPPGYVESVVLDFSRVTGIDSTALRAFQLLALRAESDDFRIEGSAASSAIQRAFLLDGDGAITQFYPHLDPALEAAENRLLNDSAKPSHSPPDTACELPLAALFQQYGSRRSLTAGDVLMKTGSSGDGIYWLVDGVLDARIREHAAAYSSQHTHTEQAPGLIAVGKVTDETGHKSESTNGIRVRRMRRGALVGEVSWLLGTPASVDVVAASDTEILHIDGQTIAKLERESPQIMMSLNHEVARIVAARLLDNARQLREPG